MVLISVGEFRRGKLGALVVENPDFSRALSGVDCINVSSSRGTRHKMNFRFSLEH